jgi:hypothetical protein
MTEILSLALTVIGLVLSYYGIRQRNKREQAVIAAHRVIERVYGSLICLKPAIVALQPNPATSKALLDAINDSLEAVNQQRESLKAL